MGLQVTYTTDSGVLLSEAYVIIDSFSGDKFNISFTISIYASKMLKDMGRQPVERHNYTIPYLGMLIDDLYDYIKTLPEFQSSISV